MARVTDVFLSGTLANVVLYRRMNTNCSRMKRNSIKQTASAKIRGANFGIASRAGEILRQGLNQVMPNPTNRSMHSRFFGAITKWLALQDIGTMLLYTDAPYVGSFGFTTCTTFAERFKDPVTVNRSASVLITASIDAFIPVKDIAAPAGTVKMELVIAVAGCQLKTGMAVGSGMQRSWIPYNDDEINAQVLQFIIPSTPGSLILTGAWLKYYIMENNAASLCENPSFLPAGIINARFI